MCVSNPHFLLIASPFCEFGFLRFCVCFWEVNRIVVYVCFTLVPVFVSETSSVDVAMFASQNESHLFPPQLLRSPSSQSLPQFPHLGSVQAIKSVISRVVEQPAPWLVYTCGPMGVGKAGGCGNGGHRGHHKTMVASHGNISWGYNQRNVRNEKKLYPNVWQSQGGRLCPKQLEFWRTPCSGTNKKKVLRLLSIPKRIKEIT